MEALAGTAGALPSIRRLDETVVNRIAAGEVLHRPANAVKEMLENSIDAGATAIQVVAKDGGLKVLQIQDNGHGIRKDDLPILCERFTTSKLEKYEDLSVIGTFGFRGEALASISHVAHVSVITRTASSPCAYRATYKDGKLGGEAAEPRPCAGNVGTQITVEDLFYNVATRRKALKSYADEYARILDVVGRYAVHYPNIAFSCKKHGANTTDLSTAGSGSALDALRIVHGASVARELLEVSSTNVELQFTMHALVSNANYSVKKGALLLFINHRAVESANLKRALDLLYSSFLPKGTHPFVYLALSLPPDTVDVNVHPTKREVHFLHEQGIIDAVVDAVHQRLVAANTSRTFLTQTLLPGVTAMSAFPAASAASASPAPAQATAQAPQQVVRTDSRSRTLDAFLTPRTSSPSSASRPSSASSQPPSAAFADEDASSDDDVDARAASPQPRKPARAIVPEDSSSDAEERDGERETGAKRARSSQGESAEPAKRVRRVVRLSSITELRAAVQEDAHSGLVEIMREHTFVGCVNARLALIQHQTRLLAVDFHELSKAFFYQQALREFSNFGRLVLSHPPTLVDLLEVALASPEAGWTLADGPKDQISAAVVRLLCSHREMLHEYFSIEIDTGAQPARLIALPLMLAGYVPNLDRLPFFLLRLASEVEWDEEKTCLDGIARELGLAYAAWPPAAHNGSPDAEAHYRWAVEHVILPGMRHAFLPPRIAASNGDVLQIASLPELYKIFERC